MKFFGDTVTAYKCCCGCMNVVTGTKIICGLTLFECFMSAVAWVITGGPFVGDGSAAIRIIIAAYISYLPLQGIQKKKPLYFIPYLFYLIILMTAAGFGAFAFASALKPDESELGFEVRKWVEDFFKPDRISPEQLDNVITFCGGVSFVVALIGSWFFSVIFKCYKYISELKATGYDKMPLPTTAY